MFSRLLLRWNRQNNHRKMPWKGIKDPYKIWLSEIILQQTKVEQGEKYYHSILAKYPSVKDLAKADETELYKLWQGLGYYNRCKNMLYTAKEISAKHKGNFPSNYQEIIQLKGIGPYTAAAISSFAFDLPHAVVDGNVVRVLSRYFGIKTDFYTSTGKKEFESLAQKLIDKKHSAAYNQAMMDLGATICKPQNPLCGECPFILTCFAKKANKINEFPVKKTKLKIKERFFHFFIFENKNSIFIQKRTGNDIWHNLYSFYSVEGKNSKAIKSDLLEKNDFEIIAEKYTQLLTHQKIHGVFYKIKIENSRQIENLGLQKIKKAELINYAFPKMIISFFEKNNYL